MDPMYVFQEGQSRSKDQIDGTGMSLGNRKGVRVTGKYVPPVDWSSRGGGPCIIHNPASIPLPPDTPTVISIGPLPHKTSERVDDPRTDEPASGEAWTKEAPSQTRVSYCEMVAPRQTMKELKTILRESPLLNIRGKGDGKPGSPYTYLNGIISSSSGIGGGGGGRRPDGRQDDGNPNRAFSTFKPRSDVSRRGPSSRESTSIQLPSSMDSSSSFRAHANTNRQAGVRAHTYASGGSGEETGASNTGWCKFG